MRSPAGLLTHFESLDAIYANLDEVLSLPIRGAKSLRTKLEQGKEDAYLSRKLVTLDTRGPLQFGDISSFHYAGPKEEGAPSSFGPA